MNAKLFALIETIYSLINYIKKVIKETEKQALDSIKDVEDRLVDIADLADNIMQMLDVNNCKAWNIEELTTDEQELLNACMGMSNYIDWLRNKMETFDCSIWVINRALGNILKDYIKSTKDINEVIIEAYETEESRVNRLYWEAKEKAEASGEPFDSAKFWSEL